MYYFTSDWHLGDKNVMKYCGRPFEDVHSMNKTIESMYNVVQDGDTVYNLGDLSSTKNFEELSKYTGFIYKKDVSNIFIYGNHDNFSDKQYKEIGFKTRHSHLKLDSYDTPELEEYLGSSTTIFLTHDPADIQTEDAIIIHGHVHNMFKTVYNGGTNCLYMNVCLDVTDYQMLSIHDIVKISKRTEFKFG